ncbi:type II toxin-antitoxin system prevent-host-death family antitoxin [Arthrobacter sp. H5]|uniref:type II toxin-antitoxin system prevent-host-death family antitoxin n=1 Tax=Arthrobacter sp. H5 TaxID=1267973 RepID=UPI000487D9BC|nr:type II toxin-antitoxin system prevent-host-death family antitoxin [Arthrobacter sp. H5]
METVTTTLTTRELRSQLSEVIGRAMYGHERVGITRNGKLSAVVISVDDLELLEQFETAQDVAAYRAAKSEDDGTRVSLTEVRSQLHG